VKHNVYQLPLAIAAKEERSVVASLTTKHSPSSGIALAFLLLDNVPNDPLRQCSTARPQGPRAISGLAPDAHQSHELQT
jgi:hypothetical protein